MGTAIGIFLILISIAMLNPYYITTDAFYYFTVSDERIENFKKTQGDHPLPKGIRHPYQPVQLIIYLNGSYPIKLRVPYSSAWTKGQAMVDWKKSYEKTPNKVSPYWYMMWEDEKEQSPIVIDIREFIGYEIKR